MRLAGSPQVLEHLDLQSPKQPLSDPKRGAHEHAEALQGTSRVAKTF